MNKIKFPIVSKVNWGIIGCGDVTEMKSGPAFQKIENSSLVAVMRRDKEKAKDYAKRHNVPYWYSDAERLIHHPTINAIYIATPPDTHAHYAKLAANAGKAVYVEKPMALNYMQCLDVITTCENNQVPLFVAYYRRSMPYFLKIKEIINSEVLGKISFVSIELHKPPRENDYNKIQPPWHIQPDKVGIGGYLYDMASHQIDLLQYYFGKIIHVQGLAQNNGGIYSSHDTFSVLMQHENKIISTGKWSFTNSSITEKDEIQIIGSLGSLSFSTFGFTPIQLKTKEINMIFETSKTEHVQLSFIESIVKQLTGNGICAGNYNEAAETNNIMETIAENRSF